MIRKQVLSPTEVGDLVPHWPDLDPDKIEGIGTRTNRRIRLRVDGKGNHTTHNVLAVPEIILCPSLIDSTKTFILNGKHRSVVSIVGGFNLAAYVVEDHRDIQNCLPKKALGDMTRDKISELFERRAFFENFCRRISIPDMRTLVNRKVEGIINDNPTGRDLNDYLKNGGTNIPF